tara:strand:+ start:1562 stop:1975 length:414 start_codon:yes stop_codon:yes gene_type:complete
MKNKIPFLVSSIITGIILFQSILIAPSINKLINTVEAAIFLRFVWPIFFLLIALLSLTSLISITINKDNNSKIKNYTIFSFLLMLFCFILVPFINNAKDENNEFLWTLLHMTTVIFTFLTLLVNSSILIRWDFKKNK